MAKQYDEDILEKLKKAEVNILKDFIGVCEKYNINYFLVWGTAIGAVRHKGFIPWDDDIDVGMLREDYIKFEKAANKELGEKYKLSTPVTEKGYASTVIKLQRKNTKFIPYMSRTMKCDLCLHIDIFVYDNLPDDKELALRNVKRTRRISHIIFLCGSPYPIINNRGIVGTILKAGCFVSHYLLKITGVSTGKLFEKFQRISQEANNSETKYIATFQSINPIKNKVKITDIYPLAEMPFEDIMVKMPKNYDKMLRKTYGNYMEMPEVSQRVNHDAYLIDFGDNSILED